MAAYKEFIRHKKELIQAMQDYSATLDEKMEIFQRTQPGAVRFDKVGGGGTQTSGTEAVDLYLVEMERRQINERLQNSREIIQGMKERLLDDETVLRMSIETDDRIYLLRFIEKKSVPDIASVLHYSQSYIFRTIKRIENEI